jgi:hypothetical protein
LGKPRYRCNDNIKIDLKGTGRGGLYWIHLAQDMKSGAFRFHKILIIS